MVILYTTLLKYLVFPEIFAGPCDLLSKVTIMKTNFKNVSKK